MGEFADGGLGSFGHFADAVNAAREGDVDRFAEEVAVATSLPRFGVETAEEEAARINKWFTDHPEVKAQMTGQQNIEPVTDDLK